MRGLDRSKSTITLSPRFHHQYYGIKETLLTALLMMKLCIQNVWVVMFLSICIDLILSLCSQAHCPVKNSNVLIPYLDTTHTTNPPCTYTRLTSHSHPRFYQTPYGIDLIFFLVFKPPPAVADSHGMNTKLQMFLFFLSLLTFYSFLYSISSFKNIVHNMVSEVPRPSRPVKRYSASQPVSPSQALQHACLLVKALSTPAVLPGRRPPRHRRRVLSAAAPQPAVPPLVNPLEQQPSLPLKPDPSINSPLPYLSTAFLPAYGLNSYCR